MKRQVTYEVGTPDSVWVPTHNSNTAIHFVAGENTVIVTITPQTRDTIIEKLTEHKRRETERAREEARKLIEGSERE